MEFRAHPPIQFVLNLCPWHGKPLAGQGGDNSAFQIRQESQWFSKRGRAGIFRATQWFLTTPLHARGCESNECGDEIFELHDVISNDHEDP